MPPQPTLIHCWRLEPATLLDKQSGVIYKWIEMQSEVEKTGKRVGAGR